MWYRWDHTEDSWLFHVKVTILRVSLPLQFPLVPLHCWVWLCTIYFFSCWWILTSFSTSHYYKDAVSIVHESLYRRMSLSQVNVGWWNGCLTCWAYSFTLGFSRWVHQQVGEFSSLYCTLVALHFHGNHPNWLARGNSLWFHCASLMTISAEHTRELFSCIYAFLHYFVSESFHKGFEPQIERAFVVAKLSLLKWAEELFLGIKIKAGNNVSWCQHGDLSRTAADV